MNPILIGSIFDLGKTLIDRFFPDKEKAAEAERELMRMMAAGELQAVLAQLQINANEANNPNPFVSGWRPFIGWCCGAGFLWATIGQPIAVYICSIKGWPLPPDLDTDILMQTMFGMLGLGALRTYEKVKKAAK